MDAQAFSMMSWEKEDGLGGQVCRGVFSTPGAGVDGGEVSVATLTADEALLPKVQAALS